jgi:hypothetical protein
MMEADAAFVTTSSARALVVELLERLPKKLKNMSSLLPELKNRDTFIFPAVLKILLKKKTHMETIKNYYGQRVLHIESSSHSLICGPPEYPVVYIEVLRRIYGIEDKAVPSSSAGTTRTAVPSPFMGQVKNGIMRHDGSL